MLIGAVTRVHFGIPSVVAGGRKSTELDRVVVDFTGNAAEIDGAIKHTIEKCLCGTIIYLPQFRPRIIPSTNNTTIQTISPPSVVDIEVDADRERDRQVGRNTTHNRMCEMKSQTVGNLMDDDDNKILTSPQLVV